MSNDCLELDGYCFYSFIIFYWVSIDCLLHAVLSLIHWIKKNVSKLLNDDLNSVLYNFKVQILTIPRLLCQECISSSCVIGTFHTLSDVIFFQFLPLLWSMGGAVMETKRCCWVGTVLLPWLTYKQPSFLNPCQMKTQLPTLWRFSFPHHSQFHCWSQATA